MDGRKKKKAAILSCFIQLNSSFDEYISNPISEAVGIIAFIIYNANIMLCGF